MTATFRGDQGRNKMLAFLQDSAVVENSTNQKNRTLAIDIYGKISETEIYAKVIEVAKTKQQKIAVVVIL